MIAITKGQTPPILVSDGEKWTAEYLQAKAVDAVTNTIRFRYRHPQIKAALVAETHNKCIYCESKIRHVHPGETEHISPVEKCPDLIVTWTNLALVCTECNRRKNDYYEPDEPLVNPYTDNPADHLTFFGAVVLPKNDKGRRTWFLLELTKRMPLLEQKIEKLEKMNLLVEKYSVLNDGATKNFLKLELLAEAANDSEYAATARSFLSQMLGWAFDRSGTLLEAA